MCKAKSNLSQIYKTYSKDATSNSKPKNKKQVTKFWELGINGSYACPLVGTQSN
jgi:hypothetical protein